MNVSEIVLDEAIEWDGRRCGGDESLGSAERGELTVGSINTILRAGNGVVSFEQQIQSI